MTLVEEVTAKIFHDMRRGNAQPSPGREYPAPEKEWPRLVLVFKPFRSSRKDRFLAEDQGLRVTVEKVKDGLWESCFEDMETGAIIAREHVQADAPDMAQLEAYAALKSSIPAGSCDVTGYKARLAGAQVTFTDHRGDPQDCTA